MLTRRGLTADCCTGRALAAAKALEGICRATAGCEAPVRASLAGEGEREGADSPIESSSLWAPS